MFGERNYGGVSPEDLGELGTPKSSGHPTGIKCPHCGNEHTYHISMEIKSHGRHPASSLLRNAGGAGSTIYGSYIGCPACPWASKMMMASVPGKTAPAPGDTVVDTGTHDDGVTADILKAKEVVEKSNAAVEAKLRAVLVKEFQSLESLCLDSAADRKTLVDTLTKSFMEKFSNDY